MTEASGFFGKLRERLGKTRTGLVTGVKAVFGAHARIDEEVFEEVEEILIQADLGVDTTLQLVDQLREESRERKLTDPQDLFEILKEKLEAILTEVDPSMCWEVAEGPHVTLVAGVNGSGKTTTIGKLASQLKQQGKSVILGAADTFRAAAVEQLTAWSERVEVPIVKHQEGADPAAVAHDAVDAAVSRGVDCLIIDTAGRLHTNVNLMEELRKIQRVVSKQIPAAPHEVLLVLDATTGQNGLQQALRFTDILSVTGIVLTKLDGTAKGGIVVAIQQQLGIPIKFIGVGEGVDDLRPFDPHEFISALFDE